MVFWMVEPGRPDFSLPNWMRLVLIVIAAFQTLGSLNTLPVLFDGDPSIPGTTPGGLLIAATILLSPVVAVAGFVWALKGELARAVMAVAGVSLLDWISYFPSFVSHWPDPSLLSFPGPLIFFVLPACAPVAIVLAWRRQWPKLSFGLAIVPWLFRALMVIAFAVGVMIYGF
jgi:hypothetical protein